MQTDSPEPDPTTLPASAAAKLSIGLDEQPGDRIGPYKLLERLGEGGFGTVWKVEQRQPVSRQLALKIIKLGMDTREVIARFEAERQALAVMEHANIASVYDAGATATGRPYFVMELVRGIPVTEFCNHHRLGVRERLDLFIDICAAVSHAHQKGIIHRDLKPSNVLVAVDADKPVPKIIDFGIAKAAQQPVTEHTLFTRSDQVVGTPFYMSPEQFTSAGLDIDTRSDIYSLGVLLYEILTGTLPFDPSHLADQSFENIRQLILEEEPRKPSTRIANRTTTTQNHDTTHRTPTQKLRATLKGDLDWIVLKTLEKDRTRRYETANALMLDIQRYLAGQDVLAAPPSTTYRLRKIVARNRGPLAAAAAIALALVAGTITSLWQASQAREARDLANERLDTVRVSQAETLRARQAAEETIAFLIEAFGSADTETTAAEVLARAEKRLGDRFGDDPTTRLKLLVAVADANSALGRHRTAESLRSQAIDLALQNLPSDDPLLYAQRLQRARDLRHFNLGASETTTRELLTSDTATRNPGSIPVLETLHLYALLQNLKLTTARNEENAAATESAIQEALAACRRHLPENHPLTLACLDQLANFHVLQKHTEQAIETFAQLTALRSAQSPPSLDYFRQLFMMSDFYYDLHDYEEAESFGRRALEGFLTELPENHREVTAIRLGLGWTLVALSRHDEARALFERNLHFAQANPADFVTHAAALTNLAHFSENIGSPEAVTYHRRALAVIADNVEPVDPLRLHAIDTLVRSGIILAGRGINTYLEEAEQLARDAFQLQQQLSEIDPSVPPPSHLRLGSILRLQGHLSQAESRLEEAVRTTADQPHLHPVALFELAMTKAALKDYRAAADHHRQQYENDPQTTSSTADGLRLVILETLSDLPSSQLDVFNTQNARLAGMDDAPLELANVASTVLLAPTPENPAVLADATALAHRAHALTNSAYTRIVVAAAHLAKSQPHETIDLLSDDTSHDDPLIACPALAYTALAHLQLGDTSQATNLWKRCQQKETSSHPETSWTNADIDSRLLVELCMHRVSQAINR